MSPRPRHAAAKNKPRVLRCFSLSSYRETTSCPPVRAILEHFLRRGADDVVDPFAHYSCDNENFVPFGTPELSNSFTGLDDAPATQCGFSCDYREFFDSLERRVGSDKQFSAVLCDPPWTPREQEVNYGAAVDAQTIGDMYERTAAFASRRLHPDGLLVVFGYLSKSFAGFENIFQLFVCHSIGAPDVVVSVHRKTTTSDNQTSRIALPPSVLTLEPPSPRAVVPCCETWSLPQRKVRIRPRQLRRTNADFLSTQRVLVSQAADRLEKKMRRQLNREVRVLRINTSDETVRLPHEVRSLAGADGKERYDLIAYVPPTEQGCSLMTPIRAKNGILPTLCAYLSEMAEAIARVSEPDPATRVVACHINTMPLRSTTARKPQKRQQERQTKTKKRKREAALPPSHPMQLRNVAVHAFSSDRRNLYTTEWSPAHATRKNPIASGLALSPQRKKARKETMKKIRDP